MKKPCESILQADISTKKSEELKLSPKQSQVTSGFGTT